jgi:WS/DGAT C-terminal domain
MVQFGVRAGAVRKLRAGNLMISNVPGPDFALYFAGMRMEQVYPMGPVLDGVALNITVQSYEDTLYVGINSSAAAVPDLPGFGHAMVDELALMSLMARGTAGATRHHRANPPAAVAAPSGHRPSSIADAGERSTASA